MRTHRHYLVAFAAVFLLSATMGFDPERDARPRFLGLNLPGFCLTNAIFGADCPGCGMTRSFILLGHGDIAESLQYHRLGVVVYLFLFTQIAYHAYMLTRRDRPAACLILRLQHSAPWALIALLLINWCYGIGSTGNGGF